jgi:type III restriction enzyme
VAETKGSMSTMELRKIEEKKIECARKFFDEINRKINPEHVKYDVLDSYEKLMEIAGMG